MPRGVPKDVVFAARLFRRQPGIVAATVAGLAVAIGVSTAVVTLVDATAFRRFGVVEPHAVVQLGVADRGSAVSTRPLAHAAYVQLRQSISSMDVIAQGWGSSGGMFRAPDDIDKQNLQGVNLTAVSGDLFRILGGRAAVGRVLGDADDAPGAASAVVLSHWFWTSRLAADPAIVQRTVWVGDQALIVVGVAQRGFTGVTDGSLVAGWITLTAALERAEGQRAADLARDRALLGQLRASRVLTPDERARVKALSAKIASPREIDRPVRLLARLKPGATLAQAEADVNASIAAPAPVQPKPGQSGRVTYRLTAIDELSSDDQSRITSVSVLVCILMLLGCANVTNLLLASAAGRRREIGTRLALGASRSRIARQLLTESLLLGCLGGIAGLGISVWTTPMLALLLHLPPTADTSLHLVAYLFIVAITVVASVVAGFAPARRSGRGDLLTALKTDRLGSPAAMAPSRLRSSLVAVQAAAAMVLLLFAGLTTRALWRASNLDLGANVSSLLNVSVQFDQDHDLARARAYVDAALERLRQLPGVAGVSRVRFPLFAAGGATDGVASRRSQEVRRNATGAEFFTTIGAPVIRGRTYTADEVRSAAPVAVISETLAREFWGADDPIGASLERLWGPDDPPGADRENWISKPAGTRIIGIVGETQTSIRSVGIPSIYLPIPQTVETREALVVSARAGQDAAALIRSVQDVLRGIDPSVSRNVESAYARFQGELDYPRACAALGILLGGSALGLALIGLFGVTAFAVVQRRQEVSLRLALGATPAGVVRLLLADGLRPVLIGLVLGLAISEPLIGSIRHFVYSPLFGINTSDPLAVSAAAVLLVLTAGVAAFVPARHAAGLNPAQMLRD